MVHHLRALVIHTLVEEEVELINVCPATCQ
jgi:hypothetical protein